MLRLNLPGSIDELMARATPRTFRLAVVTSFGYWALQMAWSRTWTLSELDVRLYDPPGPLGLAPTGIQELVLSTPVLIALALVIAVGAVSIAAGLVGGRIIPLAFCALVYLHEAIIRGYSGHVNHGELPLLMLCVGLAAIGLPAARSNGTGPPPASDGAAGRLTPEGLAIFWHLTVVVIGYLFPGLARLTKNPFLTFSDELRDMLAAHWLTVGGRFTPDQLTVPDSVDFLLDLPGWVFAVAFTMAAVLELGSVLLFRCGRWLLVLPLALLSFHLVAMFALGPFFPESMVLLTTFLAVVLVISTPVRAPAPTGA